MAQGAKLATGWLELTVSTQGAQKSMTDALIPGAKSTGDRAGSLLGAGLVGGTRSALGPIAALTAAAFGTAAIIGWGKASIDALSRIETINSQTAAAIKSTGKAAGVTAEHVQDLASSLERTTSTEAESIQEGANLLLTFKNIRNEAGEGNDIFDQTTAAMVDMARAMGTDAQGGAIQLGKALNDPIAGIAALSRVGVQFTDDQKDLITSLVEAGDVMGAQKIILGELNAQFGGSGAAYAETFAGKMDALGNAFGDIGENLFASVLPGLSDLAGQLIPMLGDLEKSSAFTDLKAQLEDIDWSGIGANIGGVAENIVKVLDAAANLANSKDANEFWANLGTGNSGTEGGPLSAAAWESGLKQIQTFFGDQSARGFDVPILTGKDLGADLDNGLAQIQEFFGAEDGNGVLGSFAHGWDQIAAVFANGGNQIGQSIAEWGGKFENGRTQINNFFYGIGAAVSSFFVDLGAKFANGGNQIGQFVGLLGAAIGQMGQSWVNGAQQIGSFFGSLGASFANGLAQIGSFFGSLGGAFANGLSQIGSFVGQAIGLIGALPGQVISALGNVGGLLFSAGQSIVGGLIDGISSMIGEVVDTLASLTSLIPQVKGPPEKDKVLLRENGQLIMGGLLRGLQEGTPAVSGYLSGVGGSVARDLGLGSAGVPAGIGTASTGVAIDAAPQYINVMLDGKLLAQVLAPRLRERDRSLA